MNPLPLPPAPRRVPARLGFSLVETVLAVGIVAFCLIALMGLLVPALQNLRSSEDDSKLPSIVQEVSKQVRSEITSHADFKNPPEPWQQNQREFYLTADLATLDPGEKSKAVYHVIVKLENIDASFETVTSEILKTLLIDVEWPYRPNGQPAQNKKHFTLLLRNPAYLPPGLDS